MRHSFTIDRSRWTQGVLCTSGGSKCALGWYYSSLGASDAVLIQGGDNSIPDTAVYDSRFTPSIVEVNDSRYDYHAQGERERRITERFHEVGIECVWEGVYRD